MTVLVDETDMAVYLYKEFAARYIAPEGGAYVIGIHRKSNGDAHTLSVRNIGCEDSGMSALAPAACTDVTAIPVQLRAERDYRDRRRNIDRHCSCGIGRQRCRRHSFDNRALRLRHSGRASDNNCCR